MARYGSCWGTCRESESGERPSGVPGSSEPGRAGKAAVEETLTHGYELGYRDLVDAVNETVARELTRRGGEGGVVRMREAWQSHAADSAMTDIGTGLVAHPA